MSDDWKAVLRGERRWAVLEADCLDVLAEMPDGCVDAVVTDPPYGYSYKSNRPGQFQGHGIANDDSTELRDAVVDWANERGISWACFGAWRVSPPVGAKTALVWNKGPASGMGDLRIPWKLSWEICWIGGRGWKGHRGEGVLSGPCVPTWSGQDQRLHPNEKPVWLLEELVGKVAGPVVVDPFAGSGTTGVAALRTGRRVILIEREPKYAALCRERLEAEDEGTTVQAKRAGQLSLLGGAK